MCLRKTLEKGKKSQCEEEKPYSASLKLRRNIFSEYSEVKIKK